MAPNARLAEQPQAATDRDGQAEVQHHDLGPLAEDRFEPGQHDVAAVERQDRQQVEEPDHRARPTTGRAPRSDEPIPGCSG